MNPRRRLLLADKGSSRRPSSASAGPSRCATRRRHQGTASEDPRDRPLIDRLADVAGVSAWRLRVETDGGRASRADQGARWRSWEGSSCSDRRCRRRRDPRRRPGSVRCVATLGVVGQSVVGDWLPRCGVGDELATARADPGIVIEGAHENADRIGVVRVAAE